MAEASKELLDWPSQPSLSERLLFVRDDSSPKSRKKKLSLGGKEKERPPITEVPKSQVLGKVQDFLGIMAQANENLERNVQGTSRSDYDIEVLTETEQEYIEMDLMLGVADLHTPEAVAAAEASLAAVQPSMKSTSSSCSDTEDDSDEDSDSGEDEMATISQLDKPNSDDYKSQGKESGKKTNKRPKIVVLN